MRGPVETPSGSQAGPLKASRKLARRIACEPQNRKTHDCEALPTPRLAEIGQVAELLGLLANRTVHTGDVVESISGLKQAKQIGVQDQPPDRTA